MAVTTRSASDARVKRTSISARAWAATTLGRVPADATPTLIVVPLAGSASALRASTWCASSSTALIPFSGSTPAWAARPPTSRTKSAMPLRAVLMAPPLAAGSRTSTAAAWRAVSSIKARELALPISSSEVDSTTIGRLGRACSRAKAACTMPAFMS